ncbi:Ig-like domain repeat protein [Paludisphaera rhizosphaerae]|uniref:Ig-like domain repeat protein n=1 Tax=Paludisphaera rhizosphaerae TaxID=2711216 RepID=UPI0013E9F25C|nr:Ig-like domain repeat protein [Paludisphaera rhizosphaerae]
MLAADSDVISVGRTLSSWTSAGVQNGQLKIQYTVYNQQPEAVSGVQLSTTLKTGVSYVSATMLPSVRTGQALSWSLGTIAPFGSATVQVTVALASAGVLQIDAGSHAAGVYQGASVADDALPASLRAGSVDPSLLAATPDADSNDPYIQAKAAELNQDPTQILAYLTQEVDYESYVGSLRGARGTLWSDAGNSLDQSSLGVALLRASGVPARYAHGTLTDALSQQLILSMFKDPLRVVGFLNPGTIASDPANDADLLAETRDHYWIQLNTGSGFQNADPSFASATIGAAFAAPTSTFAAVPDSLRHKVYLSVDRELTQSDLFGGSFQSVATVLSDVFNTVELVGRPITLGHLVTSTSVGALFAATINTYTPYLLIGDGTLDTAANPILTGQPFQEVLTNFPFGSQLLTGEFLKLHITSPDGTSVDLSKTIVDRIGAAARLGGGGSVSVDPSGQPLISPLDYTTLSIESGLYSQAAAEKLRAQLSAREAELTSFVQQANAAPDGPERDALGQRIQSEMTAAFLSAARSRLAQFLALSDAYNADLAGHMLVEAYLASPRVIAFDSKAITKDDGTVVFSLSMDLMRDVIRAIPMPGQNANADISFQLLRGMTESFTEQYVMGTPPATSTSFSILPVGIVTVLQTARDQGVPLVFLSAQNRNQLEALAITPAARAFISQALDAGKFVLVPAQSVTINGEARVGWYEFDPSTGAAVDVMDNGEHSSLIQNAATSAYVAFMRGVVEFNWGALAGLSISGIGTAFKFLLGAWVSYGDNSKKAGQFWADVAAYKNWIGAFFTLAMQLAQGFRNTPFGLGFLAGLEIGFELSNDPPLEDLLLSPAPLDAFKNLGVGAASGTKIAAAIVPDPLYTLPINGAQSPTMFRLGIKNLGSTTLRLSLAMIDLPAGFSGKTSIPEVVIPAGETAEIGLILFPTGSLPAVGTTLDFGVQITDTADPSQTTVQTASFVMPAIHGLKVTTDRDNVSSSPGTPAQIKLRLENTGNVAEAVSFQSLASEGLSVAGLAPLTLNPGQVVELNLTLTPAASTPLNQTLGLRLTTDFGTPFPDFHSFTLITAVPGATSVADAATVANRIGQPDLAARLSDLGVALTNLVGSPTSAVYKSQVVADLGAILGLLGSDPNLAPFAAGFAASRDRIASAQTPSAIQAAVTELGGRLDTFGETVEALGQGNVDLSFVNSSQVAQPQSPSVFTILVHNIGTATTTYDLAVLGLPADVASLFSQTSVTLAPDAFATVTLTLTPNSTSELSPFQFSVSATIDGSTPPISRTAVGSMSVRKEFVSVVSVTGDRSFATPGQSVEVTARVLNAVNRLQTARAVLQLINSSGQVVFTSSPVDVTLDVVASLTTVDLGAVDTTGLPVGSYILRVSLTTPGGASIPGGTGDGALMVGSPVSATLTSDKDQLPPGASVVTNTLQVQAQATLVGPLGVVSQTNLPGAGGVVKYGHYVFASGSSGIEAFDVSNPASPQLLETFGGASTILEVHGDKLYALARGGAVTPMVLSIYSLTDPANPQLLGATPGLHYALGWHMVVSDTHVFISTWSFTFLIGGVNDIKYQTGDVYSIDVSNPASPQLDGILRNTYGTFDDGIERYLNADINGGDGNLWQMQLVGPNTLLVAGSTAKGDDTQTGQGVILVIDVSDPTHMSLVKSVVIPGTVQAVKLLVDGNLAFVTASTGGWQDLTSDLPLSGDLVLATLDVSDPRNPVLLHSETIDRASAGPYNAYASALGGGLFAFSSTGSSTDSPMIFVVDASDPTRFVYSSTTIPATTEGLDGGDGYIYTTSTSGLIIYQLDAADVIPVTVHVDVPKGGGVALVPGSFSLAPTRIIAGIDSDRYEWDLNLAAGSLTRTITWQTTVSDLHPGDSRSITGTTTIDFTSQGTDGEVALPPLVVSGVQILGLSPASQELQPGGTTTYRVRVSNPTSSTLTYNLSVLGLPAGWASLPAQATVAAGGFVDVQLTMTPDAFAVLGDFGFTVQATSGTIVGSVDGNLVLAGVPLLPSSDHQSHGVVAMITSAPTIGQGGKARYVVRLTNTGSVGETFTLAIAGLPAGYTAVFDKTSVFVTPGLTGAVDVPFTIQAPSGVAAATIPFTVSTTSIGSQATAQASGILRVLSLGVQVAIVPNSVAPGSVVSMTVTNTGRTTDSFLLGLAGPASLVAELSRNVVTLAPGASTVVAITIGQISYALPGSLSLTATATSLSNSAVRSADSVDVTVASHAGVTARFETPSYVLSSPGAKTFSLLVTNTGNAEDDFEVILLGPSGPISGSLVGYSGQLTSKIPVIRLPALGTGSITLSAELLDLGLGSLRVLVRSLSNSSRTATATASLRAGAVLLTTATQITATPNPVPVGGSVTFTAYVSAQGGAIPTGQVTFIVDGVARSPVALRPNGSRALATLTMTLGAGSHSVSASYAGNTGFAASVSPSLAVTVAARTTPIATATQVLVTPSPAVAGSPVTLTALVTSPLGSLPTGLVTFTVDGVDAGTVAVTNVGGVATAVLVTLGLSEGAHSISARYLGSDDFVSSGSATTNLQVLAAPLPSGPVVTSVERFGYHHQPTSFVVGFAGDLDPVSASNVANYRIIGPGRDGRLGTKDDRIIPLRDATYDAATHTVRIRPVGQVPLHGVSLLIIQGDGGIVDQNGVALDGDDDGRPGGEYQAVLDPKKLAGPDPSFARRSLHLSRRISPVAAVSSRPVRHLTATAQRRLMAAKWATLARSSVR